MALTTDLQAASTRTLPPNTTLPPNIKPPTRCITEPVPSSTTTTYYSGANKRARQTHKKFTPPLTPIVELSPVQNPPPQGSMRLHPPPARATKPYFLVKSGNTRSNDTGANGTSVPSFTSFPRLPETSTPISSEPAPEFFYKDPKSYTTPTQSAPTTALRKDSPETKNTVAKTALQKRRERMKNHFEKKPGVRHNATNSVRPARGRFKEHFEENDDTTNPTLNRQEHSRTVLLQENSKNTGKWRKYFGCF